MKYLDTGMVFVGGVVIGLMLWCLLTAPSAPCDPYAYSKGYNSGWIDAEINSHCSIYEETSPSLMLFSGGFVYLPNGEITTYLSYGDRHSDSFFVGRDDYDELVEACNASLTWIKPREKELKGGLK